MFQSIHTEIDIQQLHPKREEVSGDVFISHQFKDEGRTILVLSDGAGHGIKANVLATLTATMALNYSSFHTDPRVAAQIIMQVLPNQADKPSYATFTVIEIEKNGYVKTINYDNPQVVILRNGNPFRPSKIYELKIEGKKNIGKILRCQEFQSMKEDRLVFVTDGVTQSGIGSKKYPMGLGWEAFRDFVITQVSNQPTISATKLAKKVINLAQLYDDFEQKDDISCGVVYFREPREIMVITGPPFYKIKDDEFIQRIREFESEKIICGGTTAEIIARKMNLELNLIQNRVDPSLPPDSIMEGFDLITEGIITIGKVEEILENYSSESRLWGSPAEEIVKMLMHNDIITFLVGTRINWAHQDPNQPVELEIRKTVVKRIVKLLEEKFFKKVNLEFI